MDRQTSNRPSLLPFSRMLKKFSASLPRPAARNCDCAFVGNFQDGMNL